MKKIFVFMSLFTILFIAFCDAKTRLKELDEAVAATNFTPSQMEIRKPLNRNSIESNSLNLPNNTNQSYQDKIREETKQHLQDSINNMERQQKRQEQKNPLKWR